MSAARGNSAQSRYRTHSLKPLLNRRFQAAPSRSTEHRLLSYKEGAKPRSRRDLENSCLALLAPFAFHRAFNGTGVLAEIAPAAPPVPGHRPVPLSELCVKSDVARLAQHLALRELYEPAGFAPRPDAMRDLLIGIAVMDVKVGCCPATHAALVGEPCGAAVRDPCALVGALLFTGRLRQGGSVTSPCQHGEAIQAHQAQNRPASVQGFRLDTARVQFQQENSPHA